MIDGIETLQLNATHDGAVWELRFDHGKANEIGTEQLDELDRLADALAADPTVRALVSTSTRQSRRGTPIFVAGANVTERLGWSDEQVKAHVRRQRKTLGRLRRAPVFHVAVVAGVAFGWGTEFLLTADYRIAASGARFALPETGLGILPGAGGTGELHAQIGMAHALRLGMTGEVIEPAEAARIGLVQEAFDDHAQAMDRARALAARAATRSPTANAAFKAAVLAAEGQDAEHRTESEAKAYERCVDLGEAAIGRANFAASRDGTPIPWGPKR